MTCDHANDRGDRRHQAYYYGFSPTGQGAIDDVLALVARAGKCYHYTDGWTEPLDCCGKSCVDLIQEAANGAAEQLATVTAERDRLRNIIHRQAGHDCPIDEMRMRAMIDKGRNAMRPALDALRADNERLRDALAEAGALSLCTRHGDRPRKDRPCDCDGCSVSQIAKDAIAATEPADV